MRAVTLLAHALPPPSVTPGRPACRVFRLGVTPTCARGIQCSSSRLLCSRLSGNVKVHLVNNPHFLLCFFIISSPVLGGSPVTNNLQRRPKHLAHALWAPSFSRSPRQKILETALQTLLRDLEGKGERRMVRNWVAYVGSES